MKKSTVLFLLAITFISTTVAFGAGTVRWNGGTTAWATAANWTTVTGTPTNPPSSADDVEMGTAAFTNNPPITTGATANTLTFGTSQAATLTIGASGSLTVSGNLIADQGVVDCQITLAAQSLTVGGNFNLGASSGNNTFVVTVTTGTLQVNGDLTVGSKGNLTYSGAGTLVLQGNASAGNNRFTPSTSTVSCNGTSAQTLDLVDGFNVLKINNAAGGTLSSATSATTLTIGDVTSNSLFSDGGNQITSTGTLNLTSGTFKIGGAANTTFPGFATRNISAGTTVEYASSSNNTQTISATPSYKILKISGTGIKAPSASLTIAEDLNIQGGILSLGTSTANRTTSGGTLTIASNATLDIGGTNGFPSNYSTHTVSSTSTVNYSGTGQTVSGENYGTLNLSGSGTKTVSGPATINRTLSIGTGTTLDPAGNLFTGSGADTLALTGTLIVDASTFGGSYLSFETRTINAGSTVQYSNANPTFDAGLTYQNLTFSGSGTAGTSGDLTVQGTLANTFPAATLNFGSSNVIISGAVANHNVSGFTTTGGLSYTATANTTTLTTSGTSVASLTMNGSGGTLNLGTNLSHTVSGNVTLTAGTLNGGTTSTLAVAGNWSGTGTFTAGTGTVNFNGAGAQALPSTATTFNNLTISGGGTKTFGSNTIVGSALTVNAGPTLAMSSFTLDQRGNLTVNGTLSGTTGAITLSTTGGATIDGSGSITNANILTINAAKTFASPDNLSFAGTIAIVGNTTVTNNGTVTTSAAGGITGSVSGSTWTQGTNAVLNLAGPLLATGTLSATASGNVVNYNGTSAQTTKGAAYITLKSNNTAGLTLSAASTLTTLTIGDVTASSIFSDGGFVITPNASSVLNLTSGTYKLGSATVGTAFPAFATINISAGTTVEYAAGVVQTVSTTPSYKNLTFSGTPARAKTVASGTLTRPEEN